MGKTPESLPAIRVAGCYLGFTVAQLLTLSVFILSYVEGVERVESLTSRQFQSKAHKRAGGLGVKIGKLNFFLLLLPQRLIEKAQVKKSGIFDTNAQVHAIYGGTLQCCLAPQFIAGLPTPVVGVIKKVSECSNRRKIVKMAYAKEPAAAATFRV